MALHEPESLFQSLGAGYYPWRLARPHFLSPLELFEVE